MLTTLNLQPQQLTRQQTQFRRPTSNLLIRRKPTRIPHIPQRVIQQQNLEIMPQRMSNHDPALQYLRNSTLHLLKRPCVFQMYRFNPTDMSSVVYYSLFRLDVGIVDLLAVKVNYTYSGECGFGAHGSYADHFAVEGYVFAYFDV